MNQDRLMSAKQAPWILIVLSMMSLSVQAEVGRYQIVTVGDPTRERFLVDTQTGMSWMLTRAPCEGEPKKGASCALNAWVSVPFISRDPSAVNNRSIHPPAPTNAISAPIDAR
jgi:hypothetical protein